MKLFAFFLFQLSLFALNTAQAAPPVLTPQVVLNGFPLCEVPSSLGQWCKILTATQKMHFVPAKIETSITPEIEDNKVTITTEDWYYTFAIERKSDDEAAIHFYDDAKFGTYLTASMYVVKWDRGIENWVLSGKMLTYIAAVGEDKKRENEYIPFPNPIPLVKISE